LDRWPYQFLLELESDILDEEPLPRKRWTWLTMSRFNRSIIIKRRKFWQTDWPIPDQRNERRLQLLECQPTYYSYDLARSRKPLAVMLGTRVVLSLEPVCFVRNSRSYWKTADVYHLFLDFLEGRFMKFSNYKLFTTCDPSPIPTREPRW
jgi:hypothetical protein